MNTRSNCCLVTVSYQQRRKIDLGGLRRASGKLKRMANAEEQTRLQIGHVLFIDIVGYSKLLVNQQSDCCASLLKSLAARTNFAKPRPKEN